MLDAADRNVIRAGQIEIRFRLESAQTAGGLSMFEFLVPAQARVPVPHSHETFDETIYGLEGVLTWVLDKEDAYQLSVITPGLLGPEYFRDIAGIVNVGGPPDIERIAQAMRRHGLRPVLPPV